jgi:formylglycine-generating enzyme required for sulfatase activity
MGTTPALPSRSKERGAMNRGAPWGLAAITGVVSVSACQRVAGLPGDVVLGACTPDDARCDGQRPQTCDAEGTWQDKAEPPCPFVCKGGACAGECSPGAARCDDLQPEACDSTGSWQNAGAPCGDGGWCSGGECLTPTSCLASGDGLSNCGPHQDESCCASPLVPGGSFLRSYDGLGYYDDPSNPATVSDFRLDRFEITVGRFRSFVSALGQGWVPPPGAGKHAHLNGGKGLNGGAEPGWDTTWNAYLPTTGLACNNTMNQSMLTWSELPGAGERLPMNCIDWYQAYAFCIWDGGSLPSEAEWNYAAARGAAQWAYPWGSAPPDQAHAAYLCNGNGQAMCSIADIWPVGSKSPLGDGYWGQADLAGNVFEWTLDWIAGNKPFYSYPNPCSDCADLGPTTPRVIRGGGWYWPAGDLASSFRVPEFVEVRDSVLGARCARAP